MTRAEWLGSLRSGELALGWRVPGLPLYRRLQLGLLKFIALSGYYYGKYCTIKEAGRRLDAPPAPRRAGPDPAAAAAVLQRRRERGDALKLAVVIPFYARTPAEMARLLAALAGLHAQSRPADAVLLVDDASPLLLPANLGNSQVQILRQARNRGPAAARNVGLRAARQQGADVVCFLDADCEPAADWLARMEAAQRAQPGVVCGLTLAASPDTAIGLYHDVCGTLNGRVLADGSLLYGCTCNLSIALAAVASEFDEAFTAAAFEDVDFCIRTRARGARSACCSAAVVMHHYRPGAVGLFRQFQRYGAAEPLVLARHARYLADFMRSREVSSLPARLPQGRGRLSPQRCSHAGARPEHQARARAATRALSSGARGVAGARPHMQQQSGRLQLQAG